VLIHPFDHVDIVAGQAGVGLEILRQIPDVSAILVPTGGGGLLAGIAAAVQHRAPQVRVIGVQAMGQRPGRPRWPRVPHPCASVSTMADGIAVPMPGTVPFGQVQATVESVHTVSEEALSRALLLCLERANCSSNPPARPRSRR
jgi:threonine dehydratase